MNIGCFCNSSEPTIIVYICIQASAAAEPVADDLRRLAARPSLMCIIIMRTVCVCVFLCVYVLS